MSAYGESPDWEGHEVDDAAIEAARMEAQVFGRNSSSPYSGGPNGEGETPKQTLRRLFEENSATAAIQIIKLASNASSERVKLDASKYIVERVLGPMNFMKTTSANDAEPGSLEHTLAQMERNMSDADSD